MWQLLHNFAKLIRVVGKEEKSMGKTKIVCAAFVVSQLLMSCANKGSGPQGGPMDKVAPQERTCSPKRNAVNARPKKVELTFDENIQLKDVQKNIVVSPPQEIAPSITANGKRLTVEFADTLRAGTTYTIDFGNAIRDLNEGNVLSGYTYAFSTGASIDSMEVSGTVLDAQTLSPLDGMVVGLYEPFDTARQDSVGPRYKMPARVARTDENGRFTLRNVKRGQYDVFALKDINSDYLFTDGEMFAWLDSSITTWAENVETRDTLRSLADSARDDKDSASRLADSIVIRQETRFYPNDLLLLASTNKYSRQRVVKTQRPLANRVDIYMQDLTDRAPQISLSEGNGHSWITAYNATNDTIRMWLSDSASIWTEELTLTVTYERQDSAGTLETVTDTVKGRYNIKNLKKQEEKARHSENANSVKLNLPGNKVQAWAAARISAAGPMKSVDASKIHVMVTADSVWEEVKAVDMTYSPTDTLNSVFDDVQLHAKWADDMRYKVVVDSGAVMTLDGKVNRQQQSEWTVDGEENYANLVVFVVPENDASLTERLPKARLQLLSDHDEVVMEAPYEKDGTRFEHVTPDNYFLRMYIDDDGNGRYTPGDWTKNRKPESTYYMKEGMKLRANWDVEQEWNPNSNGIETMKPKVLLENEKD